MTYKNILDLFYHFRSQHPILSGTTFSWGNLSDYSREDYITKYPAIHFVPINSVIDQTQNTFVWNVLVYDLLNEYVGTQDKSNQIYALSQCHEILYDFYAYFANNLTDFGFYILTPIQYSPFIDRFNQSVAGVEAQISIQVEQIACIPPFIQPSPTPSITPTQTITPSITPTQPLESPSPTATPTLTPTPTITPSSNSGLLSFIVSSGSTSDNACIALGLGNTFTIYAQDLGFCAPCLPATCWACLETSQQVYLDSGLTIPVGSAYYANNTGLGNSTWNIIGGFPQPAGFSGC
jgi:hypothetical protein